MKERDFLIGFERQVKSLNPDYGNTWKLNSDTIFYFINKAKDIYIDQLYQFFQKNQQLSDNLKPLVLLKKYGSTDLITENNYQIAEYPQDYLHALGERVSIVLNDNTPNEIVTRDTGVIEATIETLNGILDNSLSQHHLHYRQAKPIRLYTENKIKLFNDNQYKVKEYDFTYLRKPKTIGTNMLDDYLDLPYETHSNVIDLAIQLYAQSANQKDKENNKE